MATELGEGDPRFEKDPSHRYGHQKIEDLAAGAQAFLLLVGAAFVAFEAIRRLITGGTVVTLLGVGIAVVAVAAGTNLLVSGYLVRTGRATGSAALHANAADLRTDAFVSLGVLASLVAIKLTGARWIDPVVGLVVAGAISITGIRILLDSGRRLADETLPEELREIREVIDSFLSDEVVGFHDLRAGTTVLVHLEPEHRVREDRFGDASPVTDASAPMSRAAHRG